MNDKTPLLRVIVPNMLLQRDHVSSQAFSPKPEDNKLLSTYDGDQISPEAAYNHYTKDPDRSPAGILAVIVVECSAQNLPVIPDPDTFAEHVLIDFRNFGTNQIKRKAGRLRDAALARGWQYRP